MEMVGGGMVGWTYVSFLLGSVDKIVAFLGHFVGVSWATHGGGEDFFEGEDFIKVGFIKKVGVNQVQCLMGWRREKGEERDGFGVRGGKEG
jgi:hypothetical protein